MVRYRIWVSPLPKVDGRSFKITWFYVGRVMNNGVPARLELGVFGGPWIVRGDVSDVGEWFIVVSVWTLGFGRIKQGA